MSELDLQVQFKLTDFSSFISGSFKCMFEKRHGSSADVTFVLGKDVTVPAHKSVVVLHSRYLQDLLRSHNDGKDDVHISVSEASYQDMTSVLELMYLGQTYIETERVDKVATLMSQLGIQDVFSSPDQQLDYHEEETFTEKYSLKEYFSNISDKVHSAIEHEPKTREHIDGQKIYKRGPYKKKTIKATKAIAKFDPHAMRRELDIKDPELVRKAIEKLNVLPEKEVSIPCCHICGAKYKANGRLSRHMERKHPSDRKCVYCNFSTIDLKLLKSHIKNSHEEFCHKCDICLTLFVEKGALTKHKREIHGNGVHKCDLCNTEFKTLNSFEVHIADVHGQRQKCDLCEFTAKKGNVVMEHMIKKHEGKRVSCHLCEKTFSDKQTLKSHIKLVHVKIRLDCEFCPFQASIKHHLKSHILEIHGGATFQCTLCDENFQSYSRLQKHIRTVHKNLPAYDKIQKYKCDYCDWKASHKSRLKGHLEKIHKIYDNIL